MADFPAAGYLTDTARLQTEFRSGFDNFLAATKQLPGAEAPSVLVIDTGSVTPTSATHSIDTEAATPADDLTNIALTHISDGHLLIVWAESPSRIVTLKHNAGGVGRMILFDGQDAVLDGTGKSVAFQRVGTDMVERWRSGFVEPLPPTLMRTDQTNSGMSSRQSWPKRLYVTDSDTSGPAIYGNHTGANYGVYAQSSAYHGMYSRTYSSSHWGFYAANHNNTYRGYLGGTSYAVYSSGPLYCTQTINAAGTITGSNVTATSDRRLKEDIAPITEALDKVRTLNGVTFKKKDDAERGVGLIAQNVQEALPEAVRRNDDGYLTVAYGNLVGLLVEAVKELENRLEQLEASHGASHLR